MECLNLAFNLVADSCDTDAVFDVTSIMYLRTFFTCGAGGT
ncbi:hypothetical protein [Lacinutrix himadriensis]|nr:hypothetical protein [Lacinutrix himadriensis]